MKLTLRVHLRRIGALIAIACTALVAEPVAAGKADVVDVEILCQPAPGNRPFSVCKLAVRVQHADEGWEHFANRFEVLGPKGRMIGRRVLRHPHVDEQPFRRSLGPVRIPHMVKRVTIRANDLVHGLGGAEQSIDVPHEISSAAPESAVPKKGEAKAGAAQEAPAKESPTGANKNGAAAGDP